MAKLKDFGPHRPVARNITIGAIPGYNGYIDPTGKYKERLMDNLTTVKFIPVTYVINWDNITTKKGKTSIRDVIKIERTSAVQKFQMTQMANNIPTDSLAATVSLITTGDSTFNETITNDYDLNALGQMINQYRSSQTAQMMSVAGSLAGSSGFTGNIDKRDAVAGTAASQKVGEFVNGATMGAVPEDTGSALGTILGAGLGLQISLPKSWKNSSYTNTMSLSIKLTAPDGSRESVDQYIVQQLQYLLLLSTPVTANGFVTGYPYLFKIEAPGIADIPVGMVVNMTIVRGGADTVFNKDGMPTAVEVRLTVGNVFDYIASAYESALDSDGSAGITTGDNFRRSILGDFT